MLRHGRFRRLLAISAGAVFCYALLVPGMASASTTWARSVPVHDNSRASDVISHGHVQAKIVPLGAAAITLLRSNPDNISDTSSSCEDQVCIYLVGSGLVVHSWTMTAKLLLPGDCTFGAYYAPPREIQWYGPDLCNDTDTPGIYVSTTTDVVFSGPVRVCNTAVGFSGKACENIER